MEYDILQNKAAMFLILASIFTLIHLFAFFTFKHKVHSSRKSLINYNEIIATQELEIEHKHIALSKFKGANDLEKFIKKSGFEKIHPANIVYIKSADFTRNIATTA